MTQSNPVPVLRRPYDLLLFGNDSAPVRFAAVSLGPLRSEKAKSET
jgi:hypothetical protein